MSKPAYLSVEIVTDKPTSGKISIPEGSLCSWANWTAPYLVANPVFISVCLCINSACWSSDISRQTFMLTSQLLKIYFMSRTGSEFMYTYGIISSNLKPYQNFGPDLSPACLLITTSGDSWSKRPTISKQTTVILSGCARRVGGHDAWKYTLHMKNCQTPNTCPISVSFPFSGLQEHHFQYLTHNLRVLKTCFQSYGLEISLFHTDLKIRLSKLGCLVTLSASWFAQT